LAKKKRRAKPAAVQTKSVGVLESLWGLIAWLTGILVSLAVGFGMIAGTLSIPSIPVEVTATAGWIVVVLAVLGAILKIIDRLGK